MFKVSTPPREVEADFFLRSRAVSNMSLSAKYARPPSFVRIPGIAHKALGVPPFSGSLSWIGIGLIRAALVRRVAPKWLHLPHDGAELGSGTSMTVGSKTICDRPNRTIRGTTPEKIRPFETCLTPVHRHDRSRASAKGRGMDAVFVRAGEQTGCSPGC